MPRLDEIDQFFSDFRRIIENDPPHRLALSQAEIERMAKRLLEYGELLIKEVRLSNPSLQELIYKRQSDNSKLTISQLEICRVIKELTSEKGYPPTCREIAAKRGCSTAAGVRDTLLVLKRKRVVSWLPGKARTVRLLIDV